MLDSGYDLRLEPIAFAGGWAVFCESEVKVMLGFFFPEAVEGEKFYHLNGEGRKRNRFRKEHQDSSFGEVV